MADDFGFFSSSEAAGAEEDPAAAFLAQQESEIAGIENDEGFGPTDGESATAPSGQAAQPEPAGFQNGATTVNGDVFQESNGPTDAYAAIAKADRLTQEPESIRKWREEQKKRLEELDAASKVTEQEWREKAKKDLEEWNLRQNEQMEKNRANNRIADKAFYQQPDADVIGYVWWSLRRQVELLEMPLWGLLKRQSLGSCAFWGMALGVEKSWEQADTPVPLDE
ncbi:clathrin light chain B isoform X2 [Lathamus discolor]|uniref:clathrin light chain B isoform X2 n=1 Tax=Lathamus discolor TaxID=678569 RepID=UPI0032B87D53